MPIKVKCSGCGKKLNAPSKAAGKALKCPGCGEKIKVPNVQRKAAAKPKKKEEGAPDSELFISTLNLEAVEHDDFQICPKCQAQILQEEEECPKCGFDVSLGTVQAKRAPTGPIATDVGPFYKQALPDGLSFTKINMKLVMKVWVCVLICGLLGAFTGGMIIWCARWPPKLFWGFMTTIALVMAAGWVWYVHISILIFSVKTKKDKMQKVRFDFAQCAADGVKGLAWFIVYSLPFGIIFGIPGLYLGMNGSGWAIPAAAAVIFLLTTFSMPQAMSHMSMPIQYRAWLMPQIFKTFKTTLLPGLYWWALMIFTNLFWVGTMIGFYFIAQNGLAEVYDALDQHAIIRAAYLDANASLSAEAKDNPLADQDPPPVNWTAVSIMAGGWFLASFFLSFAAVFNARVNGLFTKTMKKDLDLLAHEKESTYVAKAPKDGEKKVFSLKRSVLPQTAHRLGAYFVDGVIQSVIMIFAIFMTAYIGMMIFAQRGEVSVEAFFGLIGLMIVAFGVIPFLIITIYETISCTNPDQASIGKKLFRLFVCDLEGKPISGGRAFGRAVSKILSPFFGFIFALIREDGRALHDLMAGTQVRQQKAPRVRKPKPDEDEV